jgi:hypothetical protein
VSRKSPPVAAVSVSSRPNERQKRKLPRLAFESGFTREAALRAACAAEFREPPNHTHHVSPHRSIKISIRLKPKEVAMLVRLANGEVGRNWSEVFRLLLHRAYRRNFRRHAEATSKVKERDFGSEHRIGRPPSPERNCRTLFASTLRDVEVVSLIVPVTNKDIGCGEDDLAATDIRPAGNEQMPVHTRGPSRRTESEQDD